MNALVLMNTDDLLILAVESTAVTASAAVLRGNTLLGQTSVTGAMTHSETLLPMCDSLLKSLGLSISDIGLFACTAGPGSFTGVRIGVSMIKGLAYPRSVPCAGVSTLEALAYNLHGVSGDALVVPVMDARRNQLYNAVFSGAGSGERMTRIRNDRLIAFEALMKELDETAPDRPLFFVGDGADLAERRLMSSDFEALKARMRKTPQLLRRQTAYSAGAVGLLDYMDGRAVTPDELLPVYLRMSQAERERREREAGKS